MPDLKNTYVIGIDFGTLSGRAIVARASDGEILASAVHEYEHGVMDRALTAGDGQILPPEYALQVPQDYLNVLSDAVPRAVKMSGVNPRQVAAIGIDTTSATVVVTDRLGTPLCTRPQFENNPHAYIKLWKHHGGQDQADRIVKLAKQRGESWLARYGGVLSSELLLPKALELFEKAPEVYQAAEVITDVMDWLTWQMTGVHTQSAGCSGYKRMFQDGKYPDSEYLEELAPGFGTFFTEKMSAPIKPLGSKVGELTAESARMMGLPTGIVVASGNIDAHVHAAGVNAVENGIMTAIAGTSTCFVVSGHSYKDVPGIFGVVEGGIVDGEWGFEAGQTAVGDIFSWFTRNCVPAEYLKEAKQQGIDIHQLLTQKAANQRIGEHGLIALDWWNGNRSILADARLSGLIVGETLLTRPEEIYRALLESTVFGAKMIIDNFLRYGVDVKEIVIAGGLLKNPLYMQMYADITNLPISISATEQAGALGSAVFAAVAAGLYSDVRQASAAMGKKKTYAYQPIKENVIAYRQLYELFTELHEYFGRGGSKIMPTLKRLRANALSVDEERKPSIDASGNGGKHSE